MCVFGDGAVGAGERCVRLHSSVVKMPSQLLCFEGFSVTYRTCRKVRTAYL